MKQNTHVMLTGRRADTAPAQKILDHISMRAATDGWASITAILAGFPAIRKHATLEQAMWADLTYMSNARESGKREENKGLLILGNKP